MGRFLKTLCCFVALTALLSCSDDKAPKSGFKVMSYNLLYRAEAIGDTLDLIEKSDADILCLQELTPHFLKTLQSRLGSRYPHQITAPLEGTWGIGILSKRPLLWRVLRPQIPENTLAAWGTVPFGDSDLMFACHHLMPPQQRTIDAPLYERIPHNEAIRRQQVEAISGFVNQRHGPSLVLGDLNAWQMNGNLSPFESVGLVNSCDLAPNQCSATFPARDMAPWPLSRIDHVYVKGAKVLFTQTLEGGDSDHLAIMVWLEE